MREIKTVTLVARCETMLFALEGKYWVKETRKRKFILGELYRGSVPLISLAVDLNDIIAC